MKNYQTIYIENEEHYSKVIACMRNVKKELWIGTADIKDIYIGYQNGNVSILKLLADLLLKKVQIRLLHAKEPGPIFRKDFDKYKSILTNLERGLCPRIHFKLYIFDLEMVYIGSANFTGAGLGNKSKNRRNFEAGILTNDPQIVLKAINQFDEVWRGKFCNACDRKSYCSDRLDK